MVRKIILACILCLLVTTSVFANGVSRITTVQVTGNSQKEITPDIARIRISINTINASLEQAKNANIQFSNQALAKLKEQEISDLQIKTESYRIDPLYSYENNQLPKITGYKVVNNLEITASIEKVGLLINELTNVGVNEIDSIRFEKANETGVKNDALHDAVEDALKKAKVIASALGKHISAVKEVHETGNSFQPVIMEKRAIKTSMDADALPISSGKITVSATVQVIVELEQ